MKRAISTQLHKRGQAVFNYFFLRNNRKNLPLLFIFSPSFVFTRNQCEFYENICKKTNCFILQSTLVISKDPLKHFEISVVRHIRIAVLRKERFEQPSFTNDHVI